jgi:parallel beta-helix repeat protein
MRARLDAPATALALGAISVVVGLFALGDAQALASHVACGEKITSDTTLDNNLKNCPDNGIVIGADGVTLDLNGHFIDGDGTDTQGCSDTEFCDVGVVGAGRDGTTVHDGSIRGFAVGVFEYRTHGDRLLSISARRNTFFGVVISASKRGVVRNSSLSSNIPPEGDGIGLFGSDRIRIRHNSIRRNAGPGIHVSDSDRNLIKGNVLADDDPAVAVEGDGNTVRNNDVIGGGGIRVSPGSRNRIVGNRVSHAEESLVVERGRGNLFAGNVVDEAHGNGIRLGIDHPAIGGGENVVRGNVVRGSQVDGYRVDARDGHSVLRRNIAIGSGDDGFDVESGTAKLTGNRAVHNRDLGFEAVWGVLDGGGNRAAHNGARHQCKNIVCRR